jgi:hypothetical protein
LIISQLVCGWISKIHYSTLKFLNTSHNACSSCFVTLRVNGWFFCFKRDEKQIFHEAMPTTIINIPRETVSYDRAIFLSISGPEGRGEWKSNDIFYKPTYFGRLTIHTKVISEIICFCGIIFYFFSCIESDEQHQQTIRKAIVKKYLTFSKRFEEQMSFVPFGRKENIQIAAFASRDKVSRLAALCTTWVLVMCCKRNYWCVQKMNII